MNPSVPPAPPPAPAPIAHVAIGTRTILAFWAPLAATWLMMAVEGPYIAAIIARLDDPTRNLAAYGVAYSFAFMAEAPVIMMMTAANALVADRASLLALRRFMLLLIGGVTAAMAVALLPPIFRYVTDRLIGLPPDLASLTHVSTALLLFWPAAIGYRRFYQGILVRHRQPRRVAYGTVVRLAVMSLAALALAAWTSLPGAHVGALALAVGVIAEAGASRWMARAVVSRLMEEAETGSRESGAAAAPALTMAEALRFYYPLALTSMLAMVVNPLVTFYMGRSRSPVESLAVLPVVGGLVFVFRSGALAYQEVGVALAGPDRENTPQILRVAVALAGVSALMLAGVLFTPLGMVWFERVAGLPPELARFALWPARLLAIVPALDYLLSLQRALLVLARRTQLITTATAVEATVIVIVLGLAVARLDLVGALAASLALLAGRTAGNLFLLTPALLRPGRPGRAGRPSYGIRRTPDRPRP
ncbi:MAG TPA: hypothetical protein VK911_13505 [Vicinamibacterales bacterium]|nr:hypothetical protein [Vicinamibacterales bacterium]